MVIIGKSLRTKWKPQKRHTFFFPKGTGGRISLVMVMAAWIMLDPQHFDSVWVIKFLRKNGTTHGPLSAFISYFTISARQRSTFFISKCCLRAGKSGQMIIPKVPNLLINFLGGYSTPLKFNIDTKTDGLQEDSPFKYGYLSIYKLIFGQMIPWKYSIHPNEKKILAYS